MYLMRIQNNASVYFPVFQQPILKKKEALFSHAAQIKI